MYPAEDPRRGEKGDPNAMSRKRPQQDRSAFLRERIAQYCDGGLPAEDTAELEQWLREDPRAMESFLLYMELHSQIAWNARATRQMMNAEW